MWFLILSPFNNIFNVCPVSQFCGRSGPSLEGSLVWTVALASMSGLYHCGFQRNGGSTWASGHGGNLEGEREISHGWEIDMKVICVTGMVSRDLVHVVIFLMGILSQLFAPSLFAGGNGAMDSVPHFLLGRSDRTKSQEDMWLVSSSVLHIS